MTAPWLLVAGDFVATGGMDQANLGLARALLDRGREVHLVAHRADASLLAAGARLHRVPKPARSYTLGRPLLDAAGRWCAARLAARGARVVVNGGNCPLAAVNWVHYVHAAYEPTVVGGAVQRLKGRLDRSQALARERRALRRARLVIANSRRTLRDLVERVGVGAERVRVVYYGSDPARFHPPAPEARAAARAALGWTRPTALFVGALGDRRKGLDVAFEAFRALCAGPSWDVDLAVVGRGQELPAWRARAEAAGLARRVTFLGFRDDVQRLVGAADLLVAPTRYEAYGLGVQEALCCGVPALVSADAGVAERYPAGLAPLLLPAPDADELAARLRAWRAAPERLRAGVDALGADLRARTWDVMGQELMAAVEETAP